LLEETEIPVWLADSWKALSFSKTIWKQLLRRKHQQRGALWKRHAAARRRQSACAAAINSVARQRRRGAAAKAANLPAGGWRSWLASYGAIWQPSSAINASRNQLPASSATLAIRWKLAEEWEEMKASAWRNICRGVIEKKYQKKKKRKLPSCVAGNWLMAESGASGAAPWLCIPKIKGVVAKTSCAWLWRRRHNMAPLAYEAPRKRAATAMAAQKIWRSWRKRMRHRRGAAASRRAGAYQSSLYNGSAAVGDIIELIVANLKKLFTG